MEVIFITGAVGSGTTQAAKKLAPGAYTVSGGPFGPGPRRPWNGMAMEWPWNQDVSDYETVIFDDMFPSEHDILEVIRMMDAPKGVPYLVYGKRDIGSRWKRIIITSLFPMATILNECVRANIVGLRFENAKTYDFNEMKEMFNFYNEHL